MEKVIYKFLDKLDNITPEHKPVWGQMTAQHMVEHLIGAVKMGSGKLGKIETFSPPEKLPTLKKILLSSRPLPKGFVNPYVGENLVPLEYDSLDSTLAALRIEVEYYYSFFETNPAATNINVTFGELNFSEWEVFQEKHFTHHLSQFSLL